MKKISLALISALLVSTPAFAVQVGAVIASSATGSKSVNLAPAAGLQFTAFDITISKGVSMFTTDDTTNVAVGVNSKHNASDKVFGGSTSGGSVAQCSTTNTKNQDITAAVDDTGCNTTGS